MGEKIQIKTVEMVRRIRDEQTRILAGKSNSEILAYFKNAGKKARQEAQKTKLVQAHK